MATNAAFQVTPEELEEYNRILAEGDESPRVASEAPVARADNLQTLPADFANLAVAPSQEDLELEQYNQILEEAGVGNIGFERLRENRGVFGELGAGIERGKDQTIGLGYGFVGLLGQAVGLEGVEEYGVENYLRKMEEAAMNEASVRDPFEEIDDLGDAGLYAAGIIGEQIPQLLASALGGGIGGVAAKTIGKRIVGNMINKRVSAGLAGQTYASDAARVVATNKLREKAAADVAKETAGTLLGNAGRAGGVSGAYLANFGQISGGSFGQMAQELGRGDAGIAAGFAVGGAALDTLGEVFIASKFLKPFSKAQRATVDGVDTSLSLGRIGGGAATGFAGGSVIEGGTEYVQTGLEQAALGAADPNRTIEDVVMTPEAGRERLIAAAAGATVGASLGGVGGGFQVAFSPRTTQTLNDRSRQTQTQTQTPPAGETTPAILTTEGWEEPVTIGENIRIARSQNGLFAGIDLPEELAKDFQTVTDEDGRRISLLVDDLAFGDETATLIQDARMAYAQRANLLPQREFDFVSGLPKEESEGDYNPPASEEVPVPAAPPDLGTRDVGDDDTGVITPQPTGTPPGTGPTGGQAEFTFEAATSAPIQPTGTPLAADTQQRANETENASSDPPGTSRIAAITPDAQEYADWVNAKIAAGALIYEGTASERPLTADDVVKVSQLKAGNLENTVSNSMTYGGLGIGGQISRLMAADPAFQGIDNLTKYDKVSKVMQRGGGLGVSETRRNPAGTQESAQQPAPIAVPPQQTPAAPSIKGELDLDARDTKQATRASETLSRPAETVAPFVESLKEGDRVSVAMPNARNRKAKMVPAVFAQRLENGDAVFQLEDGKSVMIPPEKFNRVGMFRPEDTKTAPVAKVTKEQLGPAPTKAKIEQTFGVPDYKPGQTLKQTVSDGNGDKAMPVLAKLLKKKGTENDYLVENEGEFTNDPLTSVRQMNAGLPIYLPDNQDLNLLSPDIEVAPIEFGGVTRNKVTAVNLWGRTYRQGADPSDFSVSRAPDGGMSQGETRGLGVFNSIYRLSPERMRRSAAGMQAARTREEAKRMKPEELAAGLNNLDPVDQAILEDGSQRALAYINRKTSIKGQTTTDETRDAARDMATDNIMIDVVKAASARKGKLPAASVPVARRVISAFNSILAQPVGPGKKRDTKADARTAGDSVVGELVASGSTEAEARALVDPIIGRVASLPSPIFTAEDALKSATKTIRRTEANQAAATADLAEGTIGESAAEVTSRRARGPSRAEAAKIETMTERKARLTEEDKDLIQAMLAGEELLGPDAARVEEIEAYLSGSKTYEETYTEAQRAGRPELSDPVRGRATGREVSGTTESRAGQPDGSRSTRGAVGVGGSDRTGSGTVPGVPAQQDGRSGVRVSAGLTPAEQRARALGARRFLVQRYFRLTDEEANAANEGQLDRAYDAIRTVLSPAAANEGRRAVAATKAQQVADLADVRPEDLLAGVARERAEALTNRQRTENVRRLAAEMFRGGAFDSTRNLLEFIANTKSLPRDMQLRAKSALGLGKRGFNWNNVATQIGIFRNRDGSRTTWAGLLGKDRDGGKSIAINLDNGHDRGTTYQTFLHEIQHILNDAKWDAYYGLPGGQNLKLNKTELSAIKRIENFWKRAVKAAAAEQEIAFPDAPTDADYARIGEELYALSDPNLEAGADRRMAALRNPRELSVEITSSPEVAELLAELGFGKADKDGKVAVKGVIKEAWDALVQLEAGTVADAGSPLAMAFKDAMAINFADTGNAKVDARYTVPDSEPSALTQELAEMRTVSDFVEAELERRGLPGTSEQRAAILEEYEVTRREPTDSELDTVGDPETMSRGLNENQTSLSNQGETNDTRNQPALQTSAEGMGSQGRGDQVQRQTLRPNAEPNPFVQDGVSAYNARYGLGEVVRGHYAPVDEQRARQIAALYDALPVLDRGAATQEAYGQLAREIQQQWDFAINDMGVTFEPWTQEGQPYANSREMVRDVRDSQHLWFFTGGEPHPLLNQPDENGLTMNDKLRAIHDLFGHAAEDYQFGPRGEENAWIKHSQMFTPLAQRALTTETRGQNSWVNYGPMNYNPDGTRRTIPASERPFAEQKVALLPEEFMDWRTPLATESRAVGIEFVSPNEAENLTFDEAKTALAGQQQAQLRAFAAKVHEAFGLGDSTVTNAIGDWADGAEPTTVTEHFNPNLTYEDIKVMAALKGAMRNQKAVIPFLKRTGGTDNVYDFFIPNQTATQTRDILEDAGIQYRTLIEQNSGTRVLVFDEDGGSQEAFRALIKKNKYEFSFNDGIGEILQGNTREEGKKVYARTVAENLARIRGTGRDIGRADSLRASRLSELAAEAGLTLPNENITASRAVGDEVPFIYTQRGLDRGNSARGPESLRSVTAATQDDNPRETGASAAQRNRIAVFAKFVDYADQNNLRMPAAMFRRFVDRKKEVAAGAEHTVYDEPTTDRVIKVTHPDVIQDGTVGAKGSAFDYFSSLLLSREFLGMDTKFEGIVDLRDDSAPRVITSQPHIIGKYTPAKRIAQELRKLGFTQDNDSIWSHPIGLKIYDAVDKNVLTDSEGNLHWIDVDLIPTRPLNDVLADIAQQKAEMTESRAVADEVTIPIVYQTTETGEAVLDNKGRPKVVTTPYSLLDSPLVNEYDGAPAENTTKPDYAGLHYTVSEPAQKSLDAAIDSGSVDEMVRRLVTASREMLKDPTIAAGMGWYGRMRTKLLNLFGASEARVFTHILGTTSAQTPVETNFEYSVDIMRRYQRGEFDGKIKRYLEGRRLLEDGQLGDALTRRSIVAKKDQQGLTEADLLSAWIEHYDLLPKQRSGKLYGTNSEAVLKALSGAWMAEKMSPKTPQFAMNLNGDSLEATIDVWAARTLRRIIYEDRGGRWRIADASEGSVSNEDFILGQVVFRRAAEKLGMNPDDLQAVVWFGEKKNYAGKGWTSAVGALKGSFDEAFDVFFPSGRPARNVDDGLNIMSFIRSERLYEYDKATQAEYDALLKDPQSDPKEINRKKVTRQKHKRDYEKRKTLRGVPAFIRDRRRQTARGDQPTDLQGSIPAIESGRDNGRGIPDRGTESTQEGTTGVESRAVSPQQDTDYLAAVERGDLETAQRMVDEAASDAQYYGPLYHQTRSSEPFSEFDNIVEGGVKGIYAADIIHIESREDTPYGDSEIEVYVKISNPLTENDLGFYKGDQGEKRTLGNVVSSPYDPKWIARMQSKGYDGIVWDGDGNVGQIVVAFDSSQIKKADPVTRDDQGNVIPLSQRFNEASPDIRESRATGRFLRERVRVTPTGGTISQGGMFSVDELLPEKVGDAFRSSRRAIKADVSVITELSRLLERQMKSLYRGQKAPRETINTALGNLENPLNSQQIAEIESLFNSRRPKQAAKKRDQFIRENRKRFREETQPAALAQLPEELAATIREMSTHIESLSRKLPQEGLVNGDLAITVDEALGTYLNRSYAIFDDPNWSESVRKNAKVMDAARKFIRNGLTQSKTADLIDDAASEGRVISLGDAQSMANDSVTDAEIEAMLDGYLAVGDESPSVEILSGRIPGQKNLSMLNPRGNIAPEIQALWGRYEDPTVNYAKTVMKLSSVIANNQFLTDLRKMGVEEGWLWSTENNPGDLRHPPGYVRISTENNPALAPIGGMYAHPMLAEGLFKMFPVGSIAQHYWWLSATMKLTGISMAMKTVGSVASQVRNYFGNYLNLVATGNLGLGDIASGDFAKRFNNSNDTVLASTFNKYRNATRAEWRIKIDDYIRRGIVGESVTTGLLEDMLTASRKAGSPDFGDAVWSKVSEPFKRVTDFAVKTYSAGDDWFKVMIYEAEQDKYRKAFPEWDDNKVKETAAKIARDIHWTYSLAPAIVQDLKKFPFVAPFVTFTTEVIRTTYNLQKLARKEIMDGRASGNKELEAMGWKRVRGMTTAAFLPLAVGSAAMAIAGISGEDEEDLRRFLPDWQKNSQLILFRKESGEVSFLDVSFLDPYEYFKKPLIAFMRSLKEADSADEILLGGTMAMVRQALDPFTSEQIFAGAIMDVMRNQDASGRQVYNPQDTGANIGTAVASKIFIEPFTPGTLTSLDRIGKAAFGVQSESGRAFDLFNEIASVTTGQRISKMDAQQALQFKGSRFMREMRDASALFNREFITQGTRSAGDVVSGYDRSNGARRSLVSNIRKDYLAAIRLGVPVARAKAILRDAGIGRETLRMATTGIYKPFEASEDSINLARARGNRDRITAYNEARRATPSKEILP